MAEHVAGRAFVPRWVIERVAAGRALEVPEEAEAAVLLVDMAGFSAMTSRLAAHGRAGAEETTAALNDWFEAVLTPVFELGGDVTSFAGDCFAALFVGAPDERLARAAAAGLRIGALGRTARMGLGDGKLCRFVVGGDAGRTPVTIGPALRVAARAVSRAEVDELVGPADRDVLTGPLVGSWRRVTGCGAPPRYAPAQVPALGAGQAALIGSFLPSAVRDGLSVPAQAGEHRPLTTLFLRLDGAAADDPALARPALERAAANVRRAGGWLQKIEAGDKGLVLLALFGAPVAIEDAPARALAAATACTEDGALAAGLTTARVFAGALGGAGRREFTVIGEAVNRAARLLQATPVGQCSCDPETAWAAPGFSFEPGAPIEAKGFAAPIELRTCTGPLAEREDEAAATPLVGREAVLSRLLAVLRGEASSPLTLRGEGGIGKSRLLREVAAHARAEGRLVAVGHFGGPRAFSAFHELARSLGVVARGAAPLEAITEALRARAPAPLVVLEDLHLAEPDDEAHLAALLSPGGAGGAIVLASTRPGAGRPLPGERLDLQPLGSAEALTLVHHLAPETPTWEALQLVERARGNPLFLEALTRQGARGGEVPRSLEEAIRVRIDRLSPPERRLLQLAAVCGLGVGPSVLRALARELGDEVVREALGSLRRHRLLVDQRDGSLRFAHALEQQVAYESLPFARRAELHREALAALRAEEAPDPAQLYDHLEAIGDRAASGAAALAAAEAAMMDLGDHRAVRFGRLALERLEDEERACRAGIVVARALVHGLDRQQGARFARLAAERAERAGLFELATTASTLEAAALSHLCQYDESDALLAETRLRAARHGISRHEPKLAKISGWNEWGRGRYGRAHARLREAIELARGSGFARERVEISTALASVCHALGALEEATSLLPPIEQVTAGGDSVFLLDHAIIAIRAIDLPRLSRALDGYRAVIDVGGANRMAFEYQSRDLWRRTFLGDAAGADRLRLGLRQGFPAVGMRYEALGTELELAIERLLVGAFDEAGATARAVIAEARAAGSRDERARAEALDAIANALQGALVPAALLAALETEADETGRALLRFETDALAALAAPAPERAERLRTAAARAEATGDRLAARFALGLVVRERVAAGDPAAADRARAALDQAQRRWGVPRLALPP